MDDQTGAARLLADYYTAFSTLNVNAILPYFHEPALLVGPQGVFAVPTSAVLTAIFAPAMEDLRSREYGRSEYELQQISSLSATATFASGIAVRYKLNGQELERVGISYLLHSAPRMIIGATVRRR